EGSFLHSGSGWYPQPATLFSYRVKLTLPAGQRGLVAGRLAAEEIPAGGGGSYRASFEFTQPADGIDLMAGPYVVREKLAPRDGGRPLRLRTYFFPDLEPLAEGYLEDSRRYIELYSRTIGEYPFSEFSVVASPLPTGFGMPTLTYLGAEVLKLPFIRATSLGHEVLHNWWGNGVYVDYAWGNWSEGLTTFMADYAYKERESAAAAREMRLAWLRDFAAVPKDAQQPLAEFRSRTHGAAAAVGYGKSAMVFFMLRDAVGEETFARGIRQFWERNRFRAASWDDLRAAFEQASGRSLKTFFEQWLLRPGGPAVNIGSARSSAASGANRLVLALEQGAPAYALRVPVEIVAGGRSETQWVELDREKQAVTLELPSVPQGVRLDPDLRLWRLLGREQLPPILRQWITARSPRLAVLSAAPPAQSAARELAQRLFETPPAEEGAEAAVAGAGPALLVGLEVEVDAALSRLGLPPRPANLAGRGTAQAWTVQREGGAPVAVVSARDAESLRALLRPLPHYGAQSYVVFEGARALERGVWPAPGRLIPVARQER
ncbi:MAG TPA: M1 family aminopeptidase, partial [Burkholderiales bacterium]|nr:M1 family aminopeptidase [Burkholderiales bacterium]